MSFFDATELSVRDQVLQSSQSRVLVGQHGAGLANMVFMKPGGTVIEIHPPLPGEAILTFKRMARACGHDYRIVPQSATHAPVDESLLSAVVFDAAKRTGVPL
jgi:capsular polysaccharide biosynthesis protein